MTAPKYKVRVDELVYREVDGKVLKALIHRPVGHDNFPALLCLHGGAWIAGDRTATSYLAEPLAASGIVLVSIDFRMAPRHPYPSSLQDINYATRWLKLHAQDYGIDIERIGGLGISSGGHLILLSAMRPDDVRYAAVPLAGDRGFDASLSFVVTCSGVLDPLARYDMAKEAGYAEIMACHRAYFRDEATMAEASPPLIIERGERVALPPLLMIQGGADARLPADTATRMAMVYSSRGATAEAHIYPDMPHALSEWEASALANVLQRISDFAGSS